MQKLQNWQWAGIYFFKKKSRKHLLGRRSESEVVQAAILLSAPGGPLIRKLQGHTNSVNAVAMTPDGRLAVSASYDATLRLWDLKSGQTLRTLKGHRDKVEAVAVTHDGRLAVSGSYDATLRLWDLESGRTIRTLEDHTDLVLAVAVTPDGRRALSGSLDQTLRLWDLGTGQRLRTLEGHTDTVGAVAVTADGRRALSGSFDAIAAALGLEDWPNTPQARRPHRYGLCRGASSSIRQPNTAWPRPSTGPPRLLPLSNFQRRECEFHK